MGTVDRAVPPASSAVPPDDDQLDSWKAIALYLKRDVTTVRRWEKKEGLPVHRHLHDRQGTVYAFKSELDAWRQRLSISSHDHAAPQVRRWRHLVGVVVLVLALAVGTAWWITWSHQPVPVPAGSVVQLTGEPGLELFPSLSPDGSWVVYAAGPTNNRDVFIRSVGSGYAKNLTADFVGTDTEPVFSPDGTQIAFRSDRDGGGIFIMDASGSGLHRVSDRGFSPSWAPGGERLAVASEDVDTGAGLGTRRGISELWIVNARTRERRRVDVEDAVQPAWSPDGRRIAYWAVPMSGSHRDIWTVGAEGEPPQRVTDDAAVDWNPVWSHDSRYLYFISDRAGTMNLWRVSIDTRTGIASSSPERVTLPSTGVVHASFSGDGSRLVWAGLSTVTTLWSVAIDATKSMAGTARRISTSADRDVSFVSPDEQLVVFRRAGGLCVSRLDGSDERPISPPSAPAMFNDWRHDSRLLSFHADIDGKTAVWTVAPDGTGLTKAIGGSATVGASVWSPKGTRLAFADFGTEPAGVAVRWLASGVVERLPAFDAVRGFRPFDWSADERFLAGYIRDGGIVIYDFRDRTYQQLTSGTDGDPRWLPDGRSLLFDSDDHPGKLLVVDRITKKVRMLEPWSAGEDLDAARLSADGRRLYVNSLRREADLWMLRLDPRAR